MRIWLIEMRRNGTDRWVPMNQPCYTLAEAQKKAKTKKCSWADVRVAAYVREEE